MEDNNNIFDFLMEMGSIILGFGVTETLAGSAADAENIMSCQRNRPRRKEVVV